MTQACTDNNKNNRERERERGGRGGEAENSYFLVFYMHGWLFTHITGAEFSNPNSSVISTEMTNLRYRLSELSREPDEKVMLGYIIYMYCPPAWAKCFHLPHRDTFTKSMCASFSHNKNHPTCKDRWRHKISVEFITKMIFFWNYLIVQNNLSEKSSHANKLSL